MIRKIRFIRPFLLSAFLGYTSSFAQDILPDDLEALPPFSPFITLESSDIDGILDKLSSLKNLEDSQSLSVGSIVFLTAKDYFVSSSFLKKETVKRTLDLFLLPNETLDERALETYLQKPFLTQQDSFKFVLDHTCLGRVFKERASVFWIGKQGKDMEYIRQEFYSFYEEHSDILSV